MRIAVILTLIVAVFSPSGRVSADVMCGEPTSTTASATPAAIQSPAIPFPADGGDLHIFAAASLTDAFGEMETELEAQYPNLNITIETAGSQTLVTQLDEGATADVLATANMSTMSTASEGELVEGEPIVFTGNRLVIVTPADNPAGIVSIDDLGNEGVNLVLANPDVPVGRYSAIALCDYQASGQAPDGFVEAVNANLVSEEPDVRHVLAKVQLGEADAGLVYASDATASMLSGVELNVVEFPADVPTRAEYPIAPVAGGNTELANAFIAYVLSEDGQAILKKYGFD